MRSTDGEVPEDITKSFQEDVQDLLEQEMEVDIEVLISLVVISKSQSKTLSMCMPFHNLSTDESGNYQHQK